MNAALGLIVAVMAGATAAQVVPDFGFMPDGGRALFVSAFGAGQDAVALLAGTGTIADWTDRIAATDSGLDDRQIRTLEGYLATTTPISGATLPDSPDIAAVLPRDGRDIALAECQSCHSLFTGYLMQKRTHDGWLAVFKSPFHMTMKVTEAERQTFADYSAVNMPLKPDQVPAELRF